MDIEDARAALAPTGTLRTAINFGNPVLAQRDAGTGAPRGVSADLAAELARRLGVPVTFTAFETAGKAFEATRDGAVDVAFLAIEPARAAELAFTAPYVIIEGTYLVREASPLRRIEDFDRPGVRIAVGHNAAYDLFLSRTLKNAELVRAPTSAAAIDLFLEEGLEAAAGVRQPLRQAARLHAGLRVVDGRFMAINQAMCVAKERARAAVFLADFVEAMKASGFVADSLARSGQSDVTVAPPRSPG